MMLQLADCAANAVVECSAVAVYAPAPKRQAAVLLIDREHEAVTALAEILAAAGYRCMCSTDGETAAACARKLTPDLILSDINLAGHSGVALCERLKLAEGMAKVPVMFLSGSQIPDIIRRSNAAGGTYYLRKPCDPDVLLKLIGKALETPPPATAAVGRN